MNSDISRSEDIRTSDRRALLAGIGGLADGVLNFFDLSAFVSLFNAQNPAADLDQNAQFNFFDVSIYLTGYNAGCP